ncbi:hypothetical protein K438DRAFT_1774937 [Mycena galopus ATCC 62051]|nr:hypothetical protein K438DRAFT_1774937 [Mycena galopus ATCC 62051]
MKRVRGAWCAPAAHARGKKAVAYAQARSTRAWAMGRRIVAGGILVIVRHEAGPWRKGLIILLTDVPQSSVKNMISYGVRREWNSLLVNLRVKLCLSSSMSKSTYAIPRGCGVPGSAASGNVRAEAVEREAAKSEGPDLKADTTS